MLKKIASTSAFALFLFYGAASHFLPDAPRFATLPLCLSAVIALLLMVPRWWVVISLAGLAIVGAVWYYDPSWLVYVPPVLLQFLIGLAFLVTLRDPDNNLIARFVRVVDGRMPPEFRIYTRQLTLAWALFLFAMAGVALGLAVFASHEWWSIFANVLSYFLLGGFFIGEYIYRLWRFPNATHSSPMKVYQALRRHGLYRVVQKGD